MISQIKQRITQVNAVISRVNKATRQSIDHYKCIFLKQSKNWLWQGNYCRA